MRFPNTHTCKELMFHTKQGKIMEKFKFKKSELFRKFAQMCLELRWTVATLGISAANTN